MRTLARVDLPDPFGPMMAWISPGVILRSTPRRISLSSTCACRPSITRIGSPIWSLLLQSHVDVLTVDADVVDGQRLRGREGARLAGPQVELRAVLGALDQVPLEPSFVHEHVLVRADVAHREDLAVDPGQQDRLASGH